MDWMPDHLINEEMTHLVSKMDSVKGKIFWRTFADEVHAAPLHWLRGVRVDDSDDRVGMYWSTWIATLKDLDIAFAERSNHSLNGNNSGKKGISAVVSKDGSFAQLCSRLVTGFKVVSYPVWKYASKSVNSLTGGILCRSNNSNSSGSSHAAEMESFYKFQKDGYDGFREGMLHARPALMEALPLTIHNSDGSNKMVWIDIGGGTARNLEFFSVPVLRKHFKAIYIVDISASLLEVAQKR